MTEHEARETPPSGKIDITGPHSARIWNYWLGGKDNYTQTGAVPYRLRSPEQIAALFDGLDLLEPGVVPVSQWRPDPPGAGSSGLPAAVDPFGGMARKR